MGCGKSRLNCQQVCAQSVNHHVIVLQPPCNPCASPCGSPCGGSFGGYGGAFWVLIDKATRESSIYSNYYYQKETKLTLNK